VIYQIRALYYEVYDPYNKEGRSPQKVVAFLDGCEETEVPEKMVHMVYDTEIEKRGRVISLG